MLPQQPHAGCLVVLVSWTINLWPGKPDLAWITMRGGRSLLEEIPGVLRGRKWGENSKFWGMFPQGRERLGIGGTSGRKGSNGSGKDVPGFYHRGKKCFSCLERASHPLLCAACLPEPARWWRAPAAARAGGAALCDPGSSEREGAVDVSALCKRGASQTISAFLPCAWTSWEACFILIPFLALTRGSAVTWGFLSPLQGQHLRHHMRARSMGFPCPEYRRFLLPFAAGRWPGAVFAALSRWTIKKLPEDFNWRHPSSH